MSLMNVKIVQAKRDLVLSVDGGGSRVGKAIGIENYSITFYQIISEL